jgi:hypothetical protein
MLVSVPVKVQVRKTIAMTYVLDIARQVGVFKHDGAELLHQYAGFSG